ncbi:uncharacterized protein LOC106657526 [Trichogramma pretiosum]|uniref:uncharacterized protein LOC106657526 n=1 Tax=Trichogramma pretiosum TaxID=7493 RepID=UPI000C71ADFD|nr:uncharacterized protein LOC106657526 [Trichogramma pretiosum]
MRAFYIILFCIFFKKIDAEPKPDLPTLSSAVKDICKGTFKPISIGAFCDKASSTLEGTFISSCFKVENICQGFQPLCKAILTDGICKDLFTNVTIGDKPTKSLGYTILHETCLKSQDVVQTVTKYLNMNIDALLDRDVACRDLTRTVRSVCRKFVNKEACSPRIIPKEFIEQCKSVLDVYVCKIRPGQTPEGTSPSAIFGSILSGLGINLGKK